MKKALLLFSLLIAKQYMYSQNVGIGTSSPAYKLDVKGVINTDSAYRINGVTVLSTSNQFNLFVGQSSGTGTTGGFNSGLGTQTLYANIDGEHNTAVGFRGLYSNTHGRYNTAIGGEALYTNITGTYNAATGYQALYFNTAGSYNTANGYAALFANTTSNNNSAFGSFALFNNTGSDNTAIGYEALKANTTGIYNTAIGVSSLRANTNGGLNTASGYNALYDNTSGSTNTATGALALTNNTTGSQNSAFGAYDLINNTGGNANTTVGYNVMAGNVNGSYNTGIGYIALYAATGANYNTALGYRAGESYDLGWNNTIVGADADLSFTGQYNSIAIGNLAICPDNSTVRIGNSANWSYGGYANWTNISDGRFKKNIREDVAGLDFIMRLRPVNYQMDVIALSEKLNENKSRQADESMKKAYAEKEKMIWTGFIAQEVEDAAKKSNFNFSGVDKPRSETGVYGLRYAEFVVPLVKAVQELSLQNDQLRKENEELAKRIQRIESILDHKTEKATQAKQ